MSVRGSCIYLAVLEPESQNEVPHEAVDLQTWAVPFALSLVHPIVLGERSDFHRLHHVRGEGLGRRDLSPSPSSSLPHLSLT